jgi:hypothetical protein
MTIGIRTLKRSNSMLFQNIKNIFKTMKISFTGEVIKKLDFQTLDGSSNVTIKAILDKDQKIYYQLVTRASGMTCINVMNEAQFKEFSHKISLFEEEV